MQDARSRLSAATVELLFEKRTDLSARQCLRNEAVAERLDGEHLVIRDFAGSFTAR